MKIEPSEERSSTEWPAGYHPCRQNIDHHALYRVNRVQFTYMNTGGAFDPGFDDAATDWREERTAPNDDGSTHRDADPMRRDPAPMVSSNATTRVRDLTYDYDWLANMVEWTDDQSVFYERSAGDTIVNGADNDESVGFFMPRYRPSALYLSTNIRSSGGTFGDGPADERGGYAALDYGQDGNVVAMTIHGQCWDVDATHLCEDPGGTDFDARRASLESGCLCQTEQHYRYDWDELNRLAEARRYDRSGGAGPWDLKVQQRYRYSAGNVRMIKETINPGTQNATGFAVTTLTPLPGDYERRGLMLDRANSTYVSSETLGSETNYMVGGARLVWDSDEPAATGHVVRERRLTMPLADLVQSTSAVVDLDSGDLIEHTTFYPNGARETHRTTRDVSLQLEPIGFTGKEADEEVGLVYFGERYLVPRLGRWASVDPLSVHQVGGGEALNGYHYVSGNLLQGRDPHGLADAAVAEAMDHVAAAENQRSHAAPSGRVAAELAVETAQAELAAARAVVDARPRWRDVSSYASPLMVEGFTYANAKVAYYDQRNQQFRASMAALTGTGGLGASIGAVGTVMSGGSHADMNRNVQVGGALMDGILAIGAGVVGAREIRRRGSATPPHGSAPAPGMVQGSANERSNRAFFAIFQHSDRAVEFIFDPASGTILISQSRGSRNGEPLSPHERLAAALGLRNSTEVVGGEVTVDSTGRVNTNEMSGHYGTNWTDVSRAQFIQAMEAFTGTRVQHEQYQPLPEGRR